MIRFTFSPFRSIFFEKNIDMNFNRKGEWFRFSIVALMILMIVLGAFTKCAEIPSYEGGLNENNKGGFITIDSFEQGDTFNFNITVWD